MRDWILITMIDVLVCAAGVVVWAFAIGVRGILRARQTVSLRQLRKRERLLRWLELPSLQTPADYLKRSFDDEPTAPRAQCSTSTPTRAEET